MAAGVHPGAVIHDWDHLVIGLRVPDGPESLLSLYAITYSASLGAGHVALLRATGAEGTEVVLALADDEGLGRRMQARLRDLGGTGPELAVPVVAAEFERHPFLAGGLGFTIRSRAATVEARWEAAGRPFWVEAPAPDLAADEDIWACFVEAHAASITIDGRAIPGEPFVDLAWEPRLGRALSSAHAALAEVRVTPHEGRRPR